MKRIAPSFPPTTAHAAEHAEQHHDHEHCNHAHDEKAHVDEDHAGHSHAHEAHDHGACSHGHQHGTHAHAHDHHAHAHNHSHDDHHHHHHGHGCDGGCSSGAVSLADPVHVAGMLNLRVPDMDCPSEESQIRRALESYAAVKSMRFDLGARTVAIDAPESDWPAIEQVIQSEGLRTERLSAPVSAEETQCLQRREVWKLGSALAFALGAEAVHFVAPETTPWHIFSMALAGVAILLSGFGVYRKGLALLLRGQLSITTLMTVAVTGAFVIGQWAEAAMVMSLYSLAEWIEARAVDRARNAIKGLLGLAPEMVEVRQGDGSWRSVAVASVAIGSVVRVKPGERLALDGRVLTGNSAVDQAPVTGESVPVEKCPGDEVFAGTINQHGALEFEVTASASDTVLARIIHAVEQAQGTRAPTQRFVDKFAAVYTPAVFVVSLAVALLGPWLAGWTWLTAIYKALVILVIACPCALVISTPVTVVSGLAAAARRGILIKGGVYLEEARKLTHIALDKTGTITEGKPCLVAYEIVRPGVDELRVWQLATGIAARSDHPVSKAIAQGLAELAGANLEVHDFAVEAGRGTSGSINGQALILGNHRWIHERGHCSPELEARMAEHERLGRSISILADEQGVLALLIVSDAIKSSSQQALQELKALGIMPVMLTGDNPASAQAIAHEAGIADVRAELLPQQKLEAMQALNSQNANTTGMVGDGINDAPALAVARVGFAMGQAGTHIATEAADVVIMNDDLRRVGETVRLSKHAHGVLWQNITLALGIKVVFLALAMLGSASMWMAVFADVGASLLVVFNGLRMLRWRG